MKISAKIYTLNLKHSFGLSRGSITEKRTVILSLSNGIHTGLGEATENSYYHILVEDMVTRTVELSTWFEQYEFTTAEKLWEDIHPKLKDMPFLQCAIDIAAHDLYGKMLGKPLHKIWGLNTDNLVQTNFTIGLDTIEKMVEKMEEQPWPLYKIKLGIGDDIETIKALRKHTDAIFRIDANAAWTLEEAIEKSYQLKDLGVEFIEQPMPDDRWDDCEILLQKSALPTIADEACKTYEDVEKCHNRFHGVNIKLAKCGGITPARKMIKKAKELGLKTMIGCMTESSVGIAAVAQLLPYLDYVDMDGALLLAKDIATGVEIVNGNVFLSDKPGTGVSLIS